MKMTFIRNSWSKYRTFFELWPLRLFLLSYRNVRNSIRVGKQRSRNQGLLYKEFKGIAETPPLRCNPDAEVEIHTLTAHHHIHMYTTALKSLLRFSNDFAVVAHDDGSFTDVDVRFLKMQIPGIKIIDKNTADREIGQKLERYPLCRKFRRSVVNAMELFDNILLSESEKTVSMNSDVLFLKRPVEFLEWICSDTRCVKSVYEETPSYQREFLEKFDCRTSPHVTLCLVGLYKDLFNTAFIEHILKSAAFDWYVAQNIYPLLFNLKKDIYPLLFFEKDRYQSSGEFLDEAVFRHYWTSTGFFNDVQFRDAACVIKELQK